MFRKFFVWLLNTYLDKYFDNLNADQLSYEILKGEIELENLSLKRDVFRSLNLPIQIRKGCVNKLKLCLGSKSYVLQIDGVYLVAEPYRFEEELDIGREALFMQELKLSALDSLEQLWKSELESKTSHSMFEFFLTTCTNIFENLQLSINDVHIRYEDEIDVSDIYVCNLMVKKLQIQSCDSNWTPGFIDLTDLHYSYKLAQLDNLSISINREQKLIDLTDYSCQTTAFKSTSHAEDLKRRFFKYSKQSYLISPISTEAHIKCNRDTKPITDAKAARVVCNVLLQQINVHLTEMQYCGIVYCVSRLENISRLRQFLCHRPTLPILKSPRKWWVYLFKCFLIQTSRKLTFKLRLCCSKNFISENIRYIKLYNRILEKNGSISLTDEEKKFKESVEWYRDYDQLRMLREIALRQLVEKQQQNNESLAESPTHKTDSNEYGQSTKAVLVSYLSYLFPSYWAGDKKSKKKTRSDRSGSQTPGSEASNSSDCDTCPFETELEEKLLNSFATATTANPKSLYHKFSEKIFLQDRFLCRFNFRMKNANMHLHNDTDSNSLFDLKFEKLRVVVESSPLRQNLVLKIKLGSMSMFDNFTKNTFFPKIIETIEPVIVPNDSKFSKGSRKNSSKPLFLLFFESNAQLSRLYMKSESLKIIYSESIFGWISDFVCKPLEKAKIEQMKHRTKKELYNQMESLFLGEVTVNDSFDVQHVQTKRRMQLNIDVAAPQVLLVDDLTSANASILGLDFGRIRMSNDSIGDRLEQSPFVSRATSVCSTGRDKKIEENQAVFDDIDDEIYQDANEDDTYDEDDEYDDEHNDDDDGDGDGDGDEDDDDDDDDESIFDYDDTYGLFVTPSESVIRTAHKNTSNYLEFNKSLLDKIYEHYRIEFTDLKVLVGGIHDNWKASRNTGISSSMHVVDNFSITMELEKRLFSIEEKIRFPYLIFSGVLPSLSVKLNETKIATLQLFMNRCGQKTDNRSSPSVDFDEVDVSSIARDLNESIASICSDELHLVQFMINEMSVSMERNNKAIAEIQVKDVKVTLSRCGQENAVGLSVMSIMIVDAMQTYGDEYCRLLSSETFIQADEVESVSNEKSMTNFNKAVVDSDKALIDIETTFTAGGFSLESVRSVSVRFNNVDLITNSETANAIVQLFQNNCTFAQSDSKSAKPFSSIFDQLENIELNFDFNRLCILLVRPIYIEESASVKELRKLAVVTVCGAKIRAEVKKSCTLLVNGSLSGIQITDLTAAAYNLPQFHRNILSVGEGDSAKVLNRSASERAKKAFEFSVKLYGQKTYDIEAQFATVNYVYLPKFLVEMQLLINDLLPMTDPATKIASDFVPYQRRDTEKIYIQRMNIFVDSPVLILPRASNSFEVFVFHLGRISLTKADDSNSLLSCCDEELFLLEIRKLNLYSLKLKPAKLPKTTFDYGKVSERTAIIDDTIVNLSIKRDLKRDRLTATANMSQLNLSLIRSQYEQFIDTLKVFESHFKMISDRVVSDSSQSNFNFDFIFKLDNLQVDLKENVSDSKELERTRRRSNAIRHLMSLVFYDFAIECSTTESRQMQFKFRLQSFYVENMQKEFEAPNRFMIKTESQSDSQAQLMPLIRKSKSFPSLCTKSKISHLFPIPTLFSNTTSKNFIDFSGFNQIKKGFRRKTDTVCQATITMDRIHGTLQMHINFHKLHAVIDSNSWLFLKDFFTIASPKRDKFVPLTKQSSKPITATVTINVLVVKLLKNEQEFAQLEMKQLELQITQNEDVMQYLGTIGTIVVKDMTTYSGQLYRNRLSISGKPYAVEFQYEVRNIQDQNVDLVVKISPLVYVHTKRFLIDLQAVLSEISHNSSNDQPDGNCCKPLKLKLSLSATLERSTVLLPVHALSSDTLLMNIAELSIQNRTQKSSDDSNLFAIGITHMELFLAKVNLCESVNTKSLKSNQLLGDNLFARKICSILPEAFSTKFKLKLDENSSISVTSLLPKIEIELNNTQYEIVRAICLHNFGEKINSENPSSPASASKPAKAVRFELRIRELQLQLMQNNEKLLMICIDRLILVASNNPLGKPIEFTVQKVLLKDNRPCKPKSQSSAFVNLLQPLHTPETADSVNFVQFHVAYSDSNIIVDAKNVQFFAILPGWKLFIDFLKSNNSDFTVPQQLQCRQPQPDPNASSMHFNLKFMNSEIVFLENLQNPATFAVCAKGTIIVSFQDDVEKWINVNLMKFELFSCQMNNVDETVLAIFDPINVSVNISKIGQVNAHVSSPLNIRLSYHDIQMIDRISKSFALKPTPPTHNDSMGSVFGTSSDESLIESLCAELHCEKWHSRRAINNFRSENDFVQKATDWLKQYVTRVFRKNSASIFEEVSANVYHNQSVETSTADKRHFLQEVDVRLSSCSLILIDDCDGETDAPFLEFMFTKSHLRTRFDIYSNEYFETTLYSQFGANYFNQVLSGWEPFIESCYFDISCECDFSWNVRLKTTSMVNVNLTKVFLQLISDVSKKWTKDIATFQTRKPFVPFALENKTGSEMTFTVKSSSSETTYYAKDNEIVNFSFETRHVKKRHPRYSSNNGIFTRNTLTVRIVGLSETFPISIDRCGVYFRHVNVICDSLVALTAYPPIRVVFDISMKDSARKLVTIRSAIVIENCLNYPIEIQFENSVTRSSLVSTSHKPPQTRFFADQIKEFIVKKKESLAVPLQFIFAAIRIRPLINDTIHLFCDANFDLFSVDSAVENALSNRALMKTASMTGFTSISSSTTSTALVSAACSVIQHRVFECFDRFSDQLFQFVAEVVHENYPIEPIFEATAGQIAQPGHRIRIIANLELINGLPCQLQFEANSHPAGYLSAFSSFALHNININEPFALQIKLDSFSSYSPMQVELKNGNLEGRIRLKDTLNRELTLNAEILVHKSKNSAWKQIRISCPYFIENLSGVPLVFKQTDAVECAAGQFETNEIASSIHPLMFSLENFEGNQSIVARVGKLYSNKIDPQWSNPISLQQGVQVRKLTVLEGVNGKRIKKNYLIGIEIDQSPYQETVTQRLRISSRYRIVNKTSHALDFSQKCLKISTDGKEVYEVDAIVMSNSSFNFHWPKFEEDHLMAIRIADMADCQWSGLFDLKQSQTIGLHSQDPNDEMYFIHLEIVEKGATIFLMFVDFNNIPAPIRFDNYTDVTLSFIQSCSQEKEWTIISPPHKSTRYALSEPLEKPELIIYSPNQSMGSKDKFVIDLDNLDGAGTDITYEQYLFISMAVKAENSTSLFSQNELVFEVDNAQNVVLGYKRQEITRQLFRRLPNGQLQLAGSEPQKKGTKKMVLDMRISEGDKAILTIRELNEERTGTQKWTITQEGLLKCEAGSFYAYVYQLKVGETVRLKSYWPVATANDKNRFRFEQFKPGSGRLTTRVYIDGPTKVISIFDFKNWNPQIDSGKQQKNKQFHLKVSMDIPTIGISLVSHNPALELLYVTLKNTTVNYEIVDKREKISAKIESVQCDNQLYDAQKEVVLYKLIKNFEEEETLTKSMVIFFVEVENRSDPFLTIFKDFTLIIQPLTIYLDESLVLELFEFFSEISKKPDSSSCYSYDFLDKLEKRYSFERISIKPSKIALSMNTCDQSLRKRPLELKEKFRLRFFKFGEAFIALNAFEKNYLFDRGSSISTQIIHHFSQKLKWQGIYILGSFNVIGNPFGLLMDVSEGFLEFLNEGNVGALVKNVTHGISDSAAKMTETISQGIGQITMDDEYMRKRHQVLQSVQYGSAKDHLSAAFQNLSNGVCDGLNGVFRKVYSGAINEGALGVAKGLGIGVVGVVTKPIVGVLDFTTETAKGLRSMSVRENRYTPNRERLPRCICGSAGLLLTYDQVQSKGQFYLYQINNQNYEEQLLYFQTVEKGPSFTVFILLSNLTIRFIRLSKVENSSALNVFKTISYSEIREVRCSNSDCYLEIVLETNGMSFNFHKLEILDEIYQQIELARHLFDEKLNTVLPFISN